MVKFDIKELFLPPYKTIFNSLILKRYNITMLHYFTDRSLSYSYFMQKAK